MIETILGGLTVIIVVSIFSYYFSSDKPEIDIKFIGVNSHIEPRLDGVSKGGWTGKLEFFNRSEIKAFNLEIISSSNNNPFINQVCDLNLLSDSENKVIVSNKIVKLLTDDERNQIAKNLSIYLPDEFINLKFILKYKDRRGRKYYTRYIKEGVKETTSYHRFRPRFKKAIVST